MLNLAVDRLFIDLGKAAQRVSEVDRADTVGVPWRQTSLRSLRARGHEQVDHRARRRTITTGLAAVERALAACLARRGGG